MVCRIGTSRQAIDLPVAIQPPRIAIGMGALADQLTTPVEGAIILSKALEDPALMGRQMRLFRVHLKLVFCP